MRCARFLERFGQEPQVARPNHRRYRRTLNCTALYTSSRPSPKSFEIGTAFERDSSASLCWSPGLNCTSKDVVPETSGVANESAPRGGEVLSRKSCDECLTWGGKVRHCRPKI